MDCSPRRAVQEPSREPTKCPQSFCSSPHQLLPPEGWIRPSLCAPPHLAGLGVPVGRGQPGIRSWPWLPRWTSGRVPCVMAPPAGTQGRADVTLASLLFVNTHPISLRTGVSVHSSKETKCVVSPSNGLLQGLSKRPWAPRPPQPQLLWLFCGTRLHGRCHRKVTVLLWS